MVVGKDRIKSGSVPAVSRRASRASRQVAYEARQSQFGAISADRGPRDLEQMRPRPARDTPVAFSLEWLAGEGSVEGGIPANASTWITTTFQDTHEK